MSFSGYAQPPVQQAPPVEGGDAGGDGGDAGGDGGDAGGGDDAGGADGGGGNLDTNLKLLLSD